MPLIRVDDLEVYYETVGEGFPVVMIMGLGANVDWWPPKFVDQLSSKFQLIMFDNRGAGRTRGDYRRFTIPRAAKDAIAFMDSLEISQAHVIGVSMGGMIAQELALTWPKRVNRLVLACSGCGFHRGARISRNTFALAWKYLTSSQVRRRAFSTNLIFTEDFLHRQPSLFAQFQERAARAPMSGKARRAQLRAVALFDSYARLPNIQAQTLVIAGDRDALMPPRNSQILASRIPNARLVTLKGCGHAFLVEAAQEAARVTEEFLLAEEPLAE